VEIARSPSKVRALTVVNLLLWAVLFVAWAPYTAALGWADPVSVEVRWILTMTAGMQLVLIGLRMARRRPVLG
jgi:hypothetical protein